MALLFKPNGYLDIATDPSDLPSQDNGGVVYSEALARCKNLRVDQKGKVKTRDGSSKINETAFASNTELVTNGTFDTNINNWTDLSSGGGAIAWSSGAMQLTSTTGTAIAQQAVSITTTNVEHTVAFDFSMSSASTIYVSIGTSAGSNDLYGPTAYAMSGSYTAAFTPTGSTVYLRFIKTTGSISIDVDNVSIKRSVDPVNLIVEQGGSRYAFAGPQIFLDESSIVSSLTDAQWSAIKYNQFNDTTQQIFALNGTDRKRITSSTVSEWGITPPSAAPTVSATGSGLTGSYRAKITYCRKVGTVVVSESNPSDASNSQTLTNNALRVSWAASSDSQVTHVRLYRTTAGGATYYHDQDIAIGATTVDTSTADSALGDSVDEDHDRPPMGQYVSGPSFDGTCFIVDDNLLYYCKPKQPEYWPALYFIEVSSLQDPGTCPVVFSNGQPHFFTQAKIYLIQGTGHGNFLPIPLDAKTGAQGPFGAVPVRGMGIFHTGPDGIYLFSGVDQKLTETWLDPIFRGETVNGVPGVSDMSTAWLHRYGNYLYFGYTSEGYSYPTNIIKFNLDTKRPTYYEYNDGDVVSIRCIANDETNNRILVGDTIGFIREIEDLDETTDSGESISWEVQSKDYTLSTRRHFPRYAKYDVDASEADSCTGEIIVDGETVQSHTITGERNVRHRHIETVNGKRCAMKISGTGVATVYAAELE